MTLAKTLWLIARWVIGITILVFAFLFAGVGIADLVLANYALGLVGLFFFAILLPVGLWVIGRPRRLRVLAKGVSAGEPYSRGRDFRVPYVVGGFLFAIILLLTLAIGGIGVAIILAAYFLGFPLGSWYFLSGPTAKLVFVRIIKSERVNRLISRVLRKDRELPRFFFAEYEAKPSIWLRFLRVVVFSFALTAALLPFVVTLNTASQIADEGLFVIIGIPILAIPSLMYVILWIYEDSGLRSFDSNSTLISVPGSKAQSLITSFVGIGAFLRLVEVVTSNAVQASALALAISFILLSPILLVVTIFHHKLEPKIVSMLRESRIAESAAVAMIPKTDQ